MITQKQFRKDMHEKIRKERLCKISGGELETEKVGIVMLDQMYHRVIFLDSTNRTFDLGEMRYAGKPQKGIFL